MGAKDAHAIQHCIRVCLETRRVCLDAVVHCLEKGDELAEIKRIRWLLECADSAWINAESMQRQARIDPADEAACTRICIECARACQSGAIDEVLTACADACWRCASACSVLAA
jgi:hypothetical protein